MLGECHKIVVEHANTRHILARKKCVLTSIRVRGNEGGYLWRSRNSNITGTSEREFKPNAKNLEPDSRAGTSLDSVPLKYNSEIECSTEPIRSSIANDELGDNNTNLVCKYTDKAAFSSKCQYKPTVSYCTSPSNECQTLERKLTHSDKQTTLSNQEKRSKDTTNEHKEQDVCVQGKDKSCTFSNAFFPGKNVSQYFQTR